MYFFIPLSLDGTEIAKFQLLYYLQDLRKCHPTRLFRPTCLLVFEELSTLHVYLALHVYLGMGEKALGMILPL